MLRTYDTTFHPKREAVHTQQIAAEWKVIEVPAC